jgi:hypothetical protein
VNNGVFVVGATVAFTDRQYSGVVWLTLSLITETKVRIADVLCSSRLVVASRLLRSVAILSRMLIAWMDRV